MKKGRRGGEGKGWITEIRVERNSKGFAEIGSGRFVEETWCPCPD